MILKKLRNNHFLSFAGNVVVAGMGILVTFLLYHYLGSKDEVGYWIFFIQNLTLADVFRTGFLQNSLIKFYAGSGPERSKNIAGSAWYIGICITLLACIINLVLYLIFHNSDNQSIQTIVNWFGITFIATLPFSVALWILQAEGRFGIILYLRVFNQGLMFVFVILLIVFHHLTVRNTVLANLISSGAASIFTIAAGWDRLKAIGNRSREGIKELFHYGKFSVGTSFASNLLRSSDIYVIKIMMGSGADAAVGVYSIPQRLMEIIEIPIRSFTSTAMPLISAASNNGDDARVVYLMKKFAGMLIIALLPICIGGFIGAGVIIDIIGGKKFAGSEAALIFRIFMTFAMLLPVDRFMGITLDMINKPRVNMIKVYIMLAVNVAGDIAGLLIFHSIYGVALASILTFTAGTVFGYWSLKKYLKFTMRDIFTLGYAELKGLIVEALHKAK
jgi:O-antigen/teichoic acid export membrane protein